MSAFTRGCVASGIEAFLDAMPFGPEEASPAGLQPCAGGSFGAKPCSSSHCLCSHFSFHFRACASLFVFVLRHDSFPLTLTR